MVVSVDGIGHVRGEPPPRLFPNCFHCTQVGYIGTLFAPFCSHPSVVISLVLLFRAAVAQIRALFRTQPRHSFEAMIHVKWDREVLHFPTPPPNTTLGRLRADIAEYTQLPKSSFKLVHAGAVMKDDQAPCTSPDRSICILTDRLTPSSIRIQNSRQFHHCPHRGTNPCSVPATIQGKGAANGREHDQIDSCRVGSCTLYTRSRRGCFRSCLFQSTTIN